MDLNLYWMKGALVFVCFSFFFFWLCVLDKAEYSAFESTLNSSIVPYRNVNILRLRAKQRLSRYSFGVVVNMQMSS